VITAVVDVDATKFVVVSEASKEAFKTATLLRTLKVNALIRGEEGVGKKTLASYILPDAPVISGENYNELLSVLQSQKELIISNLEYVANIKVLLEEAKKHNVRIVATASASFLHESVNDFFSISFLIPPLRERKEDVAQLIQKILDDMEVMLGESVSLDLETFEPDLSKNALSLKRQVVVLAILDDLQESELMEMMHHYLYEKLGSNNDYKKFLHLYEVPLIKAGLKRFKSQLQLAEKLGLNRNTLRKKIAENKEYL
jgi:DNA-binding NtrC family response regulator